MKVNVQYAKTHLSDLISAASQGEEVEIELPNQPALFLAPRPSPPGETPLTDKTGHRILGAGRGDFRVPSDEEWAAMDKEIEEQILNNPIFPSEPDSVKS